MGCLLKKRDQRRRKETRKIHKANNGCNTGKLEKEIRTIIREEDDRLVGEQERGLHIILDGSVVSGKEQEFTDYIGHINQDITGTAVTELKKEADSHSIS